jgi:protoheme IX farnesyltransferase
MIPPVLQEEAILRGARSSATVIPAWRDWLALVRPRVAVMVFLVAVLGAVLAPGGLTTAEQFGRALEAGLWITLVAGCASVMNQVLERDTDALMERTRNRPLVQGRLHTRDAIFFGATLGVVGVSGLAFSFNLSAAALSLATLFTYVSVYTPLKRVSSLNTVVGALPGAAPPLLGYVALAGAPGPWGWALFAVLFAWQFPHFMAIAWLYRQQYARAGMAMLPALPNTEGVAGRQALLYAVALLPVSLLPSISGLAGPLYGLGALVLGLAYLAASALFALREDRRRARLLVLVSLLYLPALATVILLDSVVRARFLEG